MDFHMDSMHSFLLLLYTPHQSLALIVHETCTYTRHVPIQLACLYLPVLLILGQIVSSFVVKKVTT
jgi:hypothetical protein